MQRADKGDCQERLPAFKVLASRLRNLQCKTHLETKRFNLLTTNPMKSSHISNDWLSQLQCHSVHVTVTTLLITST